MTLGNTLIGCIAFSAILLGASAFAANSKACKEPAAGSDAAPLFSPPHSVVVIGKGRLQLYSAPSGHCAMGGVFVVPKDDLVSYAETDDGWDSVMYMSPSGNVINGWARAARLRSTGTVGPNQ